MILNDAIDLLHKAALMLAKANISSGRDCIFCVFDSTDQRPLHVKCLWLQWCSDFDKLQERIRND